MPLIFADLNKKYEIIRFSGNDKLDLRIKELGFVTGNKISIISKIVKTLLFL